MATTDEHIQPGPQNGRSNRSPEDVSSSYTEAPPELSGQPAGPAGTAPQVDSKPIGERIDDIGARDVERREPVTNGRGRSTAYLVRELLTESSAMVRAEVALARSELQENVTEAKRGVAAMGSGAAVLHAGMLALVATAILALSLVWPAWLAALVVGAVITVIGAAMVAAGRRKASATGLKPDRTIRAIDNNRQFAHDEKERAMERWR